MNLYFRELLFLGTSPIKEIRPLDKLLLVGCYCETSEEVHAYFPGSTVFSRYEGVATKLQIGSPQSCAVRVVVIGNARTRRSVSVEGASSAGASSTRSRYHCGNSWYRERGYHDHYRGSGDRKCARAERLQRRSVTRRRSRAFPTIV
jgi:hypothetical protein